MGAFRRRQLEEKVEKVQLKLINKTDSTVVAATATPTFLVVLYLPTSPLPMVIHYSPTCPHPLPASLVTSDWLAGSGSHHKRQSSI